MKSRKMSKRNRMTKNVIDQSISFVIESLEVRQMLAFVGAPTGLTEPSSTTTSITLNWADNSNNETGFQIQRVINGNYVAIANTAANATTFTDTGLNPSSSYNYRVLAFSGPDISGFSYLNNATTQGVAAATPPFAPYFLSATANSATQVSLNWFDNAGTETGVTVERKTGNGA